MRVAYSISGAKELDAMLKALPSGARRVGRAAVRAAATPIAREARMRVPRLTGELRRSIAVRTIKPRKASVVAVVVGVKGREGPLAHLLEFGTGRFYTGSGRGRRSEYEIKPVRKKWLKFTDRRFEIRFRGKVIHPGIKPRPFIRTATEARASEAFARMGEFLARGLEREAAKLAKKAA